MYILDQDDPRYSLLCSVILKSWREDIKLLMDQKLDLSVLQQTACCECFITLYQFACTDKTSERLNSPTMHSPHSQSQVWCLPMHWWNLNLSGHLLNSTTSPTSTNIRCFYSISARWMLCQTWLESLTNLTEVRTWKPLVLTVLKSPLQGLFSQEVCDTENLL